MKRRWVVLLVGLAAFLVHLPAKGGGFLFYDDERFVVHNREIEHIGNPLRFFVDLETTASTEKPTTAIYRPVRTLTFAVLDQLFGKERPSWWHGFAVLLHVGCAMLLAGLLLVAGCGRWPAAAGALLFALHPVTVETTAWICSLGDLWCGLFVLLSMLAWAGDRRILACVALLLALFSKEHAVVVPGLWLAWDWFLRPERRRAPAALGGVAAGLALAVGFLFFRASVGATMAQIEGPLGGSHVTAVFTMLAGLGWYGVTLLFPFSPTFDARVAFQESLFAVPVWIGLAFLAALVYGAVRGTPRARLACVWFLIALVPVSNVFVPLKIPTADRFLYIPLMGLAFLGAELARRFYPVSAKAMPVVLLLLGLLTAVARIPDWRDDESLIEAGLRVHPKSRMLLWAEAAQHGRRAVEALAVGDARTGLFHAEEAERLYGIYIDNSHPAEQTQAWGEKGDLDYAVGDWLRRQGATEQQREFYRRAMHAYSQAFERQTLGIGRVIDEEVEHNARRLVDLSVKLADNRDRNVGATILVGLKAMDYLKREHGFDDRLPRAQLRFVDSVVVRGKHPEKSRAGFDYVLATLDELEREGGRDLQYLRAQALFYRAILKDRDFDRAGMELAYETYLAAARENAGIRVQALIYAGRAAGKIGQLFDDEKWLRRGIAVLQSVPNRAQRERLRVTREQRREIETLLREFQAR